MGSAIGRCGGIVLLAVVWTGIGVGFAAEPAVSPPAGFVDEARCAACHADAVAAWTGSQHDLAMQPAVDATVLGNFAGASFERGGVTSRFSRRDGKFVVRTDGADGKLADFSVTDTFGVAPLQQYLVDTGRGRRQALTIAWDTKAKRWFDLYPGERIDFRDELHWTKPAQNWNHMCGECHATGYRKGYDAATDSYATVAARFDVGCQACHGPAGRHLAAVGKSDPPRSRTAVKGDFDVDLAAGDANLQIETCARCHSRRATLTADEPYGKPLMDSHLPSLLDEHLYYADGQIREEVYVWGSFLQSRMYAVGVRCSDCHEPHSATLRASGNALCLSCHGDAAKQVPAHVDGRGLRAVSYDSPQHHFHAQGGPGSQCVDCHAPPRTYMVVDPRRDHSFRIPRPDLTVALGTPNPCAGCHADKSAQWAADMIAERYPAGRGRGPHYGVAIDAGRRGKAGAVAGLLALAGDASTAAIVRATALDLLANYPGRAGLQASQSALRDADPLVRRAALRLQEQTPPPQRVAALAPLLADPVRAVRIEAARQLAAVSSSLANEQRAAFDAAFAELTASDLENADRADSLVNLGNAFVARGDAVRAEELYRDAVRRDGAYVPAYANLADLYRALGREDDAEKVLREGLRALPGAAALRGALGLLLVRRGERDAALAELAAAAEAAPDDTWYSYVYAVALHDAGRRDEARERLRAAAALRGDRDVLLALAAYEREAGNLAATQKALSDLAAINPGDPALAR